MSSRAAQRDRRAGDSDIRVRVRSEPAAPPGRGALPARGGGWGQAEAARGDAAAGVRRRRGTVLARLPWGAEARNLPCWTCALALLGCLTGGCLVTEDVTYEPEPNLPPSIRSLPDARYPLERVIVLDLDALDGTQMELPLEVEVRDPNVDQELQAKVFVDTLQAASARALVPPDPEGAVARPLVVTLPLQGPLLDVGCHRIQLRVTHRFKFQPPDQPEEPGDMATATWWVFTRSPAERLVDPASCPR